MTSTPNPNSVAELQARKLRRILISAASGLSLLLLRLNFGTALLDLGWREVVGERTD
jgi:hypothetical protein